MTYIKAYDKEFKIQSVKLGRKIGFRKAAKELGPSMDVINAPKMLLDLGPGTPTPDTAMILTEEVQKLRQQNREQAK